MDKVPPDSWAEIIKVWPLGGIVLLFLTLMWRPLMTLFSAVEDRHGHAADLNDVLTAISALRAETRDEFRELKLEQRETRNELGNIRDRVARLEGASGRDQK